MSYPFFLGPNEHCLYRYYRRLNMWGYVCIPLLIFINEVFARGNLLIYKKVPTNLLSIIVLTLNSQNIYSIDLQLILFVIFPLTLCYAIAYMLLPKWNIRANKIGMNAGLPSTLSEYEVAHFYIEKRIHEISFFIWHSVLMRVSLLFAIVIPCMTINFLRNL